MSELKRRDLSGIFIFDTLPGDKKRKPTRSKTFATIWWKRSA